MPDLTGLMDYTAYGKSVGVMVARVLIYAEGDAERALRIIGTVNPAELSDPEMAEIAKGIAEQAIREAMV